MKNLLLATTFLSLLALQCKKDEKIENVEHQNALPVPAVDSSLVKNNLEMKAAPGTAALKVVPFAEKAEQGKAVFTSNGNTVFSFNTVNQTGKIIINGAEYKLNKMDFSENTYHFYGENIEINAEDGAFDEMTTDCMYGSFAEVFVTLNGKQTVLRNVKVQDCPKY